MNNKGFIATSLVYSFFLVLMVMIIAILSNYVTNKTIQERYNEVVKEDINSIEVKLHLYIRGEVPGYRINPDIVAREKKMYLRGSEMLGLTSVFDSNTYFSYSIENVKTNEDFSINYSGAITNAQIRCIPDVTINAEGSTITISNIRKETLCYIY